MPPCIGVSRRKGLLPTPTVRDSTVRQDRAAASCVFDVRRVIESTPVGANCKHQRRRRAGAPMQAITNRAVRCGEPQTGALRYCAAMQAILAVTVPFFALVLLGYLAAQRDVLPESAIPGSTPTCCSSRCRACCSGSARACRSSRLIDARLIAIYTVCALLMIAITIAVTLRRAGAEHGVDLRDAAFGALVAAFPNAASWAYRCSSRCSATAPPAR
jgi:hypothetical protein